MMKKITALAALIFAGIAGFSQVAVEESTVTTKNTGLTVPQILLNKVVGQKLSLVPLPPEEKSYQNSSWARPDETGNSSRSGTGNAVAALTVRTWTGVTNNTFNTATNWNPNAVPSATDSCVVVLAANKTISLSASIIIGALNISSGGNNNVLRIDAVGNALTINGTATLRVTSGNASTQLQMNVGNGGSITYGGSLSCTGLGANSGSVWPVLGVGGTTGTVVMKGNVTLTNLVASSATNLPASLIFDAAGSQTINNVSSLALIPLPASVLFGSVNTPTVTITGLQATFFPTNNVTVKANACLALPAGATAQDGGTLNNFNGAGTLTLNAGSVLQLGADQSDYGQATGSFNGVAGSNFPGAYSAYALNATSLIEYNSLNGVNQTVYNTPAYGNLTLTNGSGAGASSKTAGGNLTLNGNLTINALASFAGSAFTHIVKGNWANAGTFTAGTSTANFNGTLPQTISGGATTFYNFTLNNAAGTTLSAAANISNALTLTLGLLNTTAANILTMQNGSTAPALTAVSVSYVNGPMKYQKSVAGSTALNFPIGKNPDCRPVILTVNHTLATLYNYTAESFNADPWATFGSGATDMPNTVDTISGVHYVTIVRTDNTGISEPNAGLSGNQTIQMFFGTNDLVYEGPTLTIVKNTSAAPASWIDIGGTSVSGYSAVPLVGSVTSTSAPSAFNSFSSFALGSKSSGWNNLPIDLLDFTTVTNGKKADIRWSTATETNNDHFTIEKSKDGKNFLKWMEVKGAGNSLTRKDYFEEDLQPFEGISYYRLKQTDFNGVFKYFKMTAIVFNSKGALSVFPNPVGLKGNLNIVLSGFADGANLSLILSDMNGKEYFKKTLVGVRDGQLVILDNLSNIPEGVYLIEAISDEQFYHQKIILSQSK